MSGGASAACGVRAMEAIYTTHGVRFASWQGWRGERTFEEILTPEGFRFHNVRMFEELGRHQKSSLRATGEAAARSGSRVGVLLPQEAYTAQIRHV